VASAIRPQNVSTRIQPQRGDGCQPRAKPRDAENGAEEKPQGGDGCQPRAKPSDAENEAEKKPQRGDGCQPRAKPRDAQHEVEQKPSGGNHTTQHIHRAKWRKQVNWRLKIES
jgi:hypothetical protein